MVSDDELIQHGKRITKGTYKDEWKIDSLPCFEEFPRFYALFIL